MARSWTCQRVRQGVKCGQKWPRTKQKCACGGPRPKPSRPSHARVLADKPYEWWVEQYGDTCNICGRPEQSRRLDRDHDHHTGGARGLLCHMCNRALPAWATPEWLRTAADYLERSAA